MSSLKSDPKRLRVNTIPYQRNPGFFGRKNLLQEIAENLKPCERFPTIRSVAIWGTGGIGKSQIALEYGMQRYSAGIDVVLWIASETEAEVAKSFNDAASRLELPEYSPESTSGENRFAVLKWLQNSTGGIPIICAVGWG